MECFKKVKRGASCLLAAVLAVVCASVFMPLYAFADTTYQISLDDLDNCLTSYEEEQLEEVMQKTADKIKCNIGIVITGDLNGKISQSFADNYSDNLFGYNSDSIVLLLLNRHDNPEYGNTNYYKDWISTSGRARTLYDNHIDTIFDKTYRGLDRSFPCPEPQHKKNVYVYSGGTQDSIQFYMAGEYFCKALKAYSNPFSRFINNAVEFLTADFVVTFVIIVVTVLITVIVVSTNVSKYKKKKPISASTYLDRDHYKIKHEVDKFINEYTTSVRINSSSGGGRSGGGGGHGGGGGRSR